MADVPEILCAISPHLDLHSLIACTAVNRQWNAVFTPCLWRDFETLRRLWRPFLDIGSNTKASRSTITMEEDNYIERQENLAALMRQHNQHIRHLVIKHKMVLIAALEAALSRLFSLTLILDILELDDSQDSEANKCNTWISMMLTSMKEQCPLESLVPETAFVSEISGDQARMDWTRACWLMVVMNPTLRRLIISGYSNLRYINSLATTSFIDDTQLPSASIQQETKAPALTAVGQSFLVDTLSRLPKLRHLEIGMNADNFLFRNLTTLLPNLVSFVHSDRAYIDTTALQFASPHQSLQILDFQQVSLTAVQLRAIVVAFPLLRRLVIAQARSEVYWVNYDKYNSLHTSTTFQAKEMLEHSFLEILSIRHQPHINILCSRVRFPRITGIEQSIPIKNVFELRQLLWSFPALERIDSEYELGERIPLKANEIVYETRIHPIRWLRVCTSYFSTLHMGSFFAQMPHLVLIELKGGYFDGQMLVELAKSCKNLQQARFDLQEECSPQLNALFVGCPKLKSCHGTGHVIHIRDIINGPEWTCQNLFTVDFKVVGTPQLNAEQMSVLERIGDQPETDTEREIVELDKEISRIRTLIRKQTAQLENSSRIFP